MSQAMLTPQDLDNLAHAVAQRISKQNVTDETIWCAADCADYLGVSRRHFADRISNHHSFPAAIKLPSDTGKNQHRRWYAKEVIAWAKSLR